MNIYKLMSYFSDRTHFFNSMKIISLIIPTIVFSYFFAYFFIEAFKYGNTIEIANIIILIPISILIFFYMIYYLLLILLSSISTKSVQNPILLSEALEMLGACSFDEKIKIIENNGVSIFQSKIENIIEGSPIIAYENFIFYAYNMYKQSKIHIIESNKYLYDKIQIENIRDKYKKYNDVPPNSKKEYISKNQNTDKQSLKNQLQTMNARLSKLDKENKEAEAYAKIITDVAIGICKPIRSPRSHLSRGNLSNKCQKEAAKYGLKLPQKYVKILQGCLPTEFLYPNRNHPAPNIERNIEQAIPSNTPQAPYTTP